MPKTTTKSNTITVTVGEFIFEFETFTDWVNHAASWFRSVRHPDAAMCIDAIGRVCKTGREFMRANDEGTFPVKVYRTVV